MFLFAGLSPSSADLKDKSDDYLKGFEDGGGYMVNLLAATFLANSPKFQANKGIKSKDMNDGFD